MPPLTSSILVEPPAFHPSEIGRVACKSTFPAGSKVSRQFLVPRHPFILRAPRPCLALCASQQGMAIDAPGSGVYHFMRGFMHLRYSRGDASRFSRRYSCATQRDNVEPSHRTNSILGRSRIHSHGGSGDLALWRQYALPGADDSTRRSLHSGLRHRPAYAGKPSGLREHSCNRTMARQAALQESPALQPGAWKIQLKPLATHPPSTRIFSLRITTGITSRAFRFSRRSIRRKTNFISTVFARSFWDVTA